MVTFLKSTKLEMDWPESNAEVVFVGRSNVGKSSFINALYNQKIAYVGKTAGKTRLINFFDVDHKYTAVDVPGYGFANRSNKEIIDFGKMMDQYFEKREPLKLVVMIVDIRHKPTGDDLDMIEYLQDKGLEVLIVANKSDKLSYSQSLKGKKLISETLNVPLEQIHSCSAMKKTNILEIRQTIENKLFEEAS